MTADGSIKTGEGRTIFDHWEKILDFVKACVRITLIWVFSIISTIVPDSCGARTENLLLTYLVEVLINILVTGSLVWSLCATVVLTFTFNYLSTEPKLTFRTDDLNYAISSVIFVAVAVVVAILVVKLQRQVQIANKKTEIIIKLNEIGNGFLNPSGYRQIKDHSEASLANLIGKRVTVLLKKNESKEFSSPMAEWCYRQSIPCGHGEYQFPDNNELYIPIRNREKAYGTIIFDCMGWILNEEEKTYVDTVIPQITLAVERELLSKEREESRIQMERKRLKSTLSGSVSHDLRTPLAGISGSSGFLCENLEIVDMSTIKGMLKDIRMGSEWLSPMVENLLNMTRTQEGHLDINKKKEVVDDVASSAVRLVSERVGNHTPRTGIPDDILLSSVDGRLFIQVLTNLLNNAFHHLGGGTVVTLGMGVEGGNLKFVAVDDGKGLPQDKINRIFDSLFTTAYEKSDRQREAGLGLTICKVIAEAQGSTIQTYNGNQDGAVFEIRIPLEDKKDG